MPLTPSIVRNFVVLFTIGLLIVLEIVSITYLKMSQILRVFKGELMQVRRLCESRCNLRSYYEILHIPPDASQKEIRAAFIKLSKEMHPDVNKNTKHADFVKVNEAYKVLSKEYTRRQYDMDLQSDKAMPGRRIRRVYYEDVQTSRAGDPIEPLPPIYGIRGIKQVSNVTIVMICFLTSGFGLSFLLLLMKKGAAANEARNKKSAQLQKEYEKIRADATSQSMDQQIAALEQRFADREAELATRYRS